MTSPVSYPAIVASGLSKVYGSFVALDDVSFEIPDGQVVALLGPNGAGKSTTMRILTGYVAPNAGVARIRGIDATVSRVAAAAEVGYLPENGPLYGDMSPRDMLRFVGEARGFSGVDLRRRVDDVIGQCALDHVAEKTAAKLSKGLRQRVGLAQALLHEPPVLIMDEPTAGLDPNQIQDFRRMVDRLRRKRTLLISTHILQEVEAVADRILLIVRGRLVFDGSLDEMKGGGSLEASFYRLTAAGTNA